jgi:hypothetical protein
MQPTHEEWRPVVDHVGYEVSNRGRVRSYRSPGKTPGLMPVPTLLSVSPTKAGYGQVTLAAPRRKRYVHELVAAAFLGPRPLGAQIAHGDGNGLNNRVRNLRYATPVENSADRIIHGTVPLGEQLPIAKLTAERVQQIREAYGPYVRYGRGRVSQEELAARFGISQQQVNRVVSRSHCHLWDASLDKVAQIMQAQGRTTDNVIPIRRAGTS